MAVARHGVAGEVGGEVVNHVWCLAGEGDGEAGGWRAGGGGIEE